MYALNQIHTFVVMRFNNPICFHSYWLIKSHLRIVNFKWFFPLALPVPSVYSDLSSFSFLLTVQISLNRSNYFWIRLIFSQIYNIICILLWHYFHLFLSGLRNRNKTLRNWYTMKKTNKHISQKDVKEIKSLENSPLFIFNDAKENAQYTNTQSECIEFQLYSTHCIHIHYC